MKENISLSSSVLFSDTYTLSCTYQHFHLLSIKPSSTPSLTSPHYRVAVSGTSHLLYPLVSKSMRFPSRFYWFFLLYCFPLFFRKLSPYACSIAILFPQVGSSFDHCYNQYSWLGLTQYGLSYVNSNWKYSLNLCICLLPANTTP